MKTKANKKSADRAFKEAVSKAFDTAPDYSISKMLLGDVYRGIAIDGKRGWSDKRLTEMLRKVRLNPNLSGECAAYINAALAMLESHEAG